MPPSEVLENRPALLAHREDIAADSGKKFCTFKSSERARDFLFHLDHTDILFCQVVGEGNFEIMEKSKHSLFYGPQIDQVGFGLWSAVSGRLGIGIDEWINRPSITKDFLVLLMPFF